MAESLVLGDIELLGGSVVSTNPMCAGAVFRLLPGYDPGAPQPDTALVASLLLDGELNIGTSASNRAVTLPVWIMAPDRDTLAGAVEHLQQTIEQDIWLMTWARQRDTTGVLAPLPVIFDCQRAAATVMESNIIRAEQMCQKLTIKFPALPYIRSDTRERIQFDSPVPSGPPAPVPPVVIDNFSTISSPQTFQSPRCVVGPFTCCWDPDSQYVNDPGGQTTQFEYSAVLANVISVAGMSSVGMWLGFGSRWYWNLPYQGQHTIRVTLTLFDTHGNELAFAKSDQRLPCTPLPQQPVFSRVTLRVPQNDPVFDYGNVAGYEMTVSNHHPFGDHHLRWVTMYVDALTAYPDSQTSTPVVRGSVYTLRGIKGTARAPMSSSFTQPATAGTPTTVTATGIGSYTVPSNASWLKVEAVGGGGAGSSRTSAGLGGGGGGAEYSREDVFAVVPGEIVPLSVGTGAAPGAAAGTTQFGPGQSGPLVVVANGGQSAPVNSTTGGHGGTGSGNAVHHDGGAGRTASGAFGGGGGGSGGSAANGGTPLGTSASSYTTAGTFSFVCPAGTTQLYAEAWGGGGSGGTGYPNGNGQGGSGGEYSASYVPVTPGNTYTVIVGGGGAAVSGTQHNGNPGGTSSFTGDSGQAVTAHPGLGGVATNNYNPNPGGSGSGNAVHFAGGAGGAALPYGGGGGSSASPSGGGNAGNGYGGAGTAPTDGGAGGAGSGATNNNGTAGMAPGGGGGGTYGTVTSGPGAAGKVRLTFPGGSPDQFGAPAVTGGGAGGNGAATVGGTPTAGAQPGGGGGGTSSSGSAQTAASGGAGRLIITPYAPSAFKSLLVHRPPRGASPLFQPLVSVGAGADTPDGTHWYTLPQPQANVNALFLGTYTIYLAASSLNGTGSRTVTVTIRQTEYAGGPTYTQPTIPVTFTPSQLTNGLLVAGVVTLPVKQIPPDNTQASFAVSVTDTNTADRWYDAILLDSQGQTVLVNEPSTGFLTYYLDAPNPDQQLGNVLGTQSDRSASVSVMGEMPAYSGGPMAVEPADGVNVLFAYCAGALAPAIGVQYAPTYYFDRII